MVSSISIRPPAKGQKAEVRVHNTINNKKKKVLNFEFLLIFIFDAKLI